MLSISLAGRPLSRPFAALLFDMDGTLVDSRVVVERVWRDWAAQKGIDAEKLLARSHGRRTVDTVRDFALPGMDVEAEAARLDAIEVEDSRGIVAAPGAANLLAKLPPDCWAVVTSAGRDLAERRLLAAGLPLPKVLVSAEDVAQGKPDPEGYVKAARLLGTAAEHCIVFEDAPAGLEAGRRAGSETVAILAAQPHPFTPDGLAIEDFTELTFEHVGKA